MRVASNSSFTGYTIQACLVEQSNALLALVVVDILAISRRDMSFKISSNALI